MLAKALKLPWPDLRLALCALVYLGVITLVLKWCSLRSVRRWLQAAPAPGDRRGRCDPVTHAEASRYHRAMYRAARWLSPATCMDQSVALWAMLKRRGYAANVRLGVRRNDTTLEAHAWVESAGRVIFDCDPNSRYQPLATDFLSSIPQG
ncbi:MAG: lasso peptide biosynthesis B2 protein [Gammaproteobacteria bacterium]|nr:lasso peptide biosynthesis B2 protein [Gammaproteobacteria bacterium]